MSGRPAEKKRAIAELTELLPKLDGEGVAFLLEQARVHLHNMGVVQREKAAARTTGKAAAAAAKAGAAPPRRRPPSAGGGPATGAFRVERSDDGETYHLVSAGAWKLFTAEEMAAMVAIVRGEGREEEHARRLRAWLGRERRDALSDFSIGAPGDARTVQLVRALREAFSGKKGKGGKK